MSRKKSKKTNIPRRTRTRVVDLLDATERCHKLKMRTKPAAIEIKVTANTEGIRCRASDGSAGLQVRCWGAANTTETAILDTSPLLKALRTLSKGLLDITFEEDHVVLLDEAGKEVDLYNHVLDESRALPQWPDRHELEATGTVPAELDFVQVLADIATHASEDEARININAIHFEHDGERAYVVATDGHRLALCSRLFAWSKYPKGFNVRPTVASYLPTKHPLTITACKNVVFFEAAHVSLWVNRSHCTFPPFRDVIPKEFGKKGTPSITVERADLADVTRFVSKLAESKSGVSFTLDVDASELNFEHNHNVFDTPVGRASIKTRGMPSSTARMLLNAHYLHAADKIVKDERVRLYWTGPLDPVVVSDRNRDNLVVLMPMRC